MSTPAEPLKRVVLFVDGFNVYHTLDASSSLHPYKWLNYSALGRQFLKTGENLVKTYYFTALPPWDQEKRNRHEKYISALRAHSVTPVLGTFRNRTRNCKTCKAEFATYEEKETDVNIAVQMLQLAYTGEYDTAMLLTGDSDQVPTIKAVLKAGKSVRVIIPLNHRADELKAAASEHQKMTIDHLQKCQLPDEVKVKEGVVIKRLWSPTRK